MRAVYGTLFGRRVCDVNVCVRSLYIEYGAADDGRRRQRTTYRSRICLLFMWGSLRLALIILCSKLLELVVVLPFMTEVLVCDV